MEYQYYAFISYNHKDSSFAGWLHKNLESFKLPSNQSPKSLRPIFKDRDELSSGVLADELNDRLKASRYLIVLCSENSAGSKWVSDEVSAFISMGRYDSIIPVLLSENPDDLPQALKVYNQDNPRRELLGISVPQEGRDRALIKVVSRMLSVNFDVLWDRQRRAIRKKRWIRGIIIAAICLLLFMLYNSWNTLTAEKTQRKLDEAKVMIQRGELLPASETLMNLISTKFGKKASTEILSEIQEYMCDSDAFFPAYVFTKDIPWDDKLNESVVSVSNDGEIVAWIDNNNICFLVKGGSVPETFKVPEHADIRVDDYSIGFQLHSLKFVPGTHMLIALSSDGIILYDCDESKIVSDIPSFHGWMVKRGQSTTENNYYPYLSVSSSGDFFATLSDHLLRIWTIGVDKPLKTIPLTFGEQLAFINDGGKESLAVYERYQSLKGIQYIDLHSFSIRLAGGLSLWKDFKLLPSGGIIHQNEDGSWYFGEEYTMILNPTIIPGTDNCFGEQSGYNQFIVEHLSCDSENGNLEVKQFLSLPVVYWYGYDFQNRYGRAIISDEAFLYPCEALTTLVIDDGHNITVLFLGTDFQETITTKERSDYFISTYACTVMR